MLIAGKSQRIFAPLAGFPGLGTAAKTEKKSNFICSMVISGG
jgi:hypothetical protein